MTQDHPTIARYMVVFAAELKRLGVADHDEIVAEIRSHCAEAQAAGQTADAVLETLGSPHALARAYAMELLMTQNTQQSRVGRVFAVIGILAASGIGSLLVVMALGSIAVAFFGSGLTLLAIGALEVGGVHLPEVRLAGLNPLVVLALGPFVTLIGIVAAIGLWRYLRWLTRSLRTVLGRNRMRPT